MNKISSKTLARLSLRLVNTGGQTQHGLSNLSQSRNMSSQDETATQNFEELDKKMLEILVCPITKKPLRYNKETNELISDKIKVAYPIVNGVPNLVPQDGRVIEEDGKN